MAASSRPHRRMLVGGVFVTALVGTCLSLGSSSAQAFPTDCRTDTTPTSATSVCHGGNGVQKVVVDCFGLTYLSLGNVAIPWVGSWPKAGPTVGLGIVSTASCTDGPRPVPWEVGVSTGARAQCGQPHPRWNHYIDWRRC